MLGIVLVFAALPRMLFVREVLFEWDRLEPDLRQSYRIAYLDPDSRGYLRLANRILDGAPLKAGNLHRPPGYPTFLALLGARPDRVLFVQALLGTFVVLCVTALTFACTRKAWLGLAAGLLSALSPTGIGIVALIMSDLLLATLFAVGIAILLLAARRRHSGLLVGAGVVFALATLTKPILLLWSPVSLLVFWLLSGRRLDFVRPATLALFVGLQLAPTLLWCGANYTRYGTFTYSILGPLTVRTYWGARTEAWIEAGGEPSNEQTRRKQQQVRQRFSELSGRDKVRLYREENRLLLRRYPIEMARTFVVNVEENTSGGWNLFQRQVPLRPELARIMISFSRLEGTVREVVRWLVALVLVSSPVLWALVPASRSNEGLLGAFALSVVWLYFVVLGGITFWTGPRLLYPVQFAEIVVPLAILNLAVSSIGRRHGLTRQQGCP